MALDRLRYLSARPERTNQSFLLALSRARYECGLRRCAPGNVARSGMFREDNAARCLIPAAERRYRASRTRAGPGGCASLDTRKLEVLGAFMDGSGAAAAGPPSGSPSVSPRDAGGRSAAHRRPLSVGGGTLPCFLTRCVNLIIITDTV